jgi:hypothetical protein
MGSYIYKAADKPHIKNHRNILIRNEDVKVFIGLVCTMHSLQNKIFIYWDLFILLYFYFYFIITVCNINSEMASWDELNFWYFEMFSNQLYNW